MFSKLKQFYQLFKIGQQVSDPLFWKKTQAIVQPIVAGAIVLLVTILKGVGIDLPISNDLAFGIAGALFFIVNSALTIVTSKTVGLPSDVKVVPSVQPSTTQTTQKQPLPSDNEAHVEHNPIDENTRKRAEQWRLQQSSNGLANDA
jgi:hypothetical protein